MKSSLSHPILKLVISILVLNAVCIFPVFAEDPFSSTDPKSAPNTCSAGAGTDLGVTTQIDPAALLDVARNNEKFAAEEQHLIDEGYTRDEIIAYTITHDNNRWGVLHTHYVSDTGEMNLWFSQNPDTGEIAIVKGQILYCGACIVGILTYAPACAGACIAAPETIIFTVPCFWCLTLGPVALLCTCLNCGCLSGVQDWCDRRSAQPCTW